MTHQDLQKQLMKAATKLKAILFVNRRGFGWFGKHNSTTGKYTTLEHARRVEVGLVNGSSDLIGWTKVEITAAMVGRTVAIFTAVEAKVGTDRLSKLQRNFIRVVKESGGIAVEGRGVDDLGKAVLEFKNGKS